jgi:Flp pilus assembly protein CpaB
MNRRWAMPALAVLLALLTTAVVVGYLQTLRRPPAAVPVAMTGVVVAKRTIATRHIIGAADLELRQIPVSGAHPRALHNVDQAINQVAVSDIFEGEQVITDMLAPAGVGASLSYVVPKGMLAVTIAVNEIVDVAGFIAPGDRVDVVGTVTPNGSQQISRIFLQNVLVLAIAQTPDQKPGQPPKVTTSVTVALTPQQVEGLTQIDDTGRLRLALRPAGSTAIVETRGETTVSALNGLGAPAAIPAVAAPAGPRVPIVIVRPVQPVAPPESHTVEIWRSTQKQMITF